MEELIAAGAVAFSDDGRCVMNETLFKEALKIAKHLHVPLIEHPEDHSISLDGQLNEGEVSARLNVKGIPASSEDRIIERDIQFQEEINSNLHLTHISTTGALKLIADAKKRNIPVTADVTPHHLVLDETFITQPFSAYKMKPPLRTPADRLAMIEGIKNHTIDCIASDHAPHSPEEKAQPFENTPFGIIGLETTFPILHDRLVKQGIIDLKRFIELLSTNPAKIINLQDRGIVKPGVPADLTLFDPDRPFEIKTQDFRSKSVNSPFIGWKGEGAVMYTIVNGKIVYRNDETAGRSHKD